jgi:UDP-glucose 4-epimerase
MKTVLVTGGLGFIGSHTCVELLNNNFNVIVIDNLFNSKLKVIHSIEKITNKKIKFYKIDLLHKNKLENIFINHQIDLVIHFAGLKSVNESISKPLLYYDNNITGSINLFKLMEKYNIFNLIFSSSATVYGNPDKYPVDENTQTGNGITNPYGQTKYMIEQILKDLYNSNNKWNITCLRYFNPVGAHPSGLIGEDPNDIPNNLFPHILSGKLTIFGNDYETSDGTCIRDFIHVVDLSNGHIKAIDKLKGYNVYNLGTGKGTSVLQFINTFEKVNNVKIDYTFGDRRKGDICMIYANVDKANKQLNWKTIYSINDVCKHGYHYFINH